MLINPAAPRVGEGSVVKPIKLQMKGRNWGLSALQMQGWDPSLEPKFDLPGVLEVELSL